MSVDYEPTIDVRMEAEALGEHGVLTTAYAHLSEARPRLSAAARLPA